MSAIRFISYSVGYVFFYYWEKLTGRYTGYYDWPKRSLAEYIRMRDVYYNLHQQRLDRGQGQ